MALTIGITGGIGSGKSIVCKIFHLLGAPVFEADRISKELLNTDQGLKDRLIREFGEAIYRPDGIIDRKKLAGIIFNDDVQLSKMNALVHPAVKDAFLEWTAQHQEVSYIIHEAAILFESGFYRMMDFTLLVSAPEEQRIWRVMKRDGISEEKVRERMKNQFSEEKKQKMATFVLRNDNSHLIIPEILRIDKKLKTDGKIW